MPYEYRINGQVYDIESDDPQAIEESIKAIRSVEQENYEELFTGGPDFIPTAGNREESPEARTKRETGFRLSHAATSMERAKIIREAYPSSRFELDEEGRLITILTDPETFEETIGWVNAPGLSQMDVNETMSQLQQGAVAALPAGKVRLFSRLFTGVARAAVTGASEAGLQMLRQSLIDDLGADIEGIPDDDMQQTAHVVMAGLLGFGGELAGVGIDFFYRALRNKRYFSGNTLTEAGEEAMKELGIDPNFLTADVVREIKKGTSSFDAATVQALADSHPELLARASLFGKAGQKGAGVDASVKAFKTHYDARMAEVDDLFEHAREFNVKIPEVATLEARGRMVSEMAKAGKDPIEVPKQMRLWDKWMLGSKGAGGKDFDATIRGYDAVRRNLNAEIRGLRNANPDDPKLVALTTMRKVTDNFIDDLVAGRLRHYRVADPTAAVELKRANAFRKYVGERYENSDSLLSAVRNMDSKDPMTPGETADFLIGAHNAGAKGATGALKQIKEVVGENSPEWLAVKDDVFRSIADSGPDFSSSNLRRNWHRFKQNHGQDGGLLNVLFSREDIKAIDDLTVSHISTRKFLQTVGDFLTVRYGVSGSAVAGSIRRLGNIRDAVFKVRNRSIFSNIAASGAPVGAAHEDVIKDEVNLQIEELNGLVSTP